ncbi:hypothetical protein ACO22_01655 [Paracoccidioides brasiliensis]|uniref:C2H2-type domain-containing protein n=1 Tax=Paracoccidioides brasiliensis TaxID=121759 RepID=A0A1D2JKY2_PARBR|nr:hypothetical protein ACO22_01655 [Paracoccidioides brasiliensis]
MQLRGMSLWPSPGEKHDVEMDPEERSLMTFSDVEHNRDKERPGRKYHHENNTGNLSTTPEPETSILGSINDCPSCLRMFKSVTALTAHCESASVRCKINKDKNYAAIMDEISAGLIGADGENEDGSVRYRTISAEEAGIDLKKVD